MAPGLIAYIADETKKEADITKASRKAREERLTATSGLSAEEVAAMIAKQAAAGTQGGDG